MTDTFEFRCRCCGETHAGWPDWHFAAPAPALAVPPDERDRRVELTADGCVIDGREFYAKGLLGIPIRGAGHGLTWGVWVSLGEADFREYARLFDDRARVPGRSFLGWLSNAVPGFESEEPLAARLHVRAYPSRPWVELAPTAHPLAVAQRDGIAREDAVARVEQLLHPTDRA